MRLVGAKFLAPALGSLRYQRKALSKFSSALGIPEDKISVSSCLYETLLLNGIWSFRPPAPAWGRRQDLGSVWAQISAALDACGHWRLAGGDYKVCRQFGGGLS